MSIMKFVKSISAYKKQAAIILAFGIMLAVPFGAFASVEDTLGVDDRGESARLFFEKASDKSSQNRELYYLASISQDPTNADYCWAYISYLDETAAPGSAYYALGSLVEAAILNNSYNSVEALVEVYNYIVNECLSTTVEDNSLALEEEKESQCTRLKQDIQNLWDMACSGLSYSAFKTAAATIEDEYSSLRDYVDDSVRERYELLSETAELLESLNSTVGYINRLTAMSDSEFLSSYAYVASGLDNACATVVLIDTSYYGVFSPLVEDTCLKISKGLPALDSRYDNLLLSDIYLSSIKMLRSITKKNTVTITDKSRYNSVKAEYERIVKRYSSVQNKLRGTDEAVTIISNISDCLSEVNSAIYKFQYQSYQIWAANLLQTIKDEVEKAKNEAKLETLYKEGYYTISVNSLIPKLQTLYSSLYKDSYTKNSAKTDAELMEIYGVDIKSIGEV